MMIKASLCSLVLFSLPSFAQTGVYFSHNDWEIACDNTLTCRAAGYQREDSEPAVSLLFTRKAGANQAVTIQVALGDNDNESLLKNLPEIYSITMYINNTSYGDIEIHKDKNGAELSATQTTALLNNIKQNAEIVFVEPSQHARWQVSDNGAAAVFLKMDDVQGRINTQSALIKKGNNDLKQVHESLPTPVIDVPAIPATTDADKKWLKKNQPAIIAALNRTLKKGDDNECPLLKDNSDPDKALTVNRISRSQLLISTACWQAAYNDGAGYWLINDNAPFKATLVTAMADDFEQGEISYHQKGRGLGDCWSVGGWAWNGKQFVVSSQMTTGMCRMVVAGGAWSLPTYISEIHHK
jgi:hypothetical protein